ncbi:MAG: hydroxyacylglutathione hydrolase [Alphaproteobacteria bacterium]|nr:hydroxyacylglutathione hydrolase [Alphaproteobacteria bacterium]
MGFSIDLLPAKADNYIYLVSDVALGLAMVVDPSDANIVEEALYKKDLQLALILNTHHHSDHIAGNNKLQRDYGAPIIGPAKEKTMIENLSRGVEDGDVITFSDLRGHVIETPGHTSGSISYYFPDIKALFCGDTLFSLGCGRVFEGTAAQLWYSLLKLRALPDDTQIYAGHEYTAHNMPFALMLDSENAVLRDRANEVLRLREKGLPTLPVSLAKEKATNPFLRVDEPAFQKILAGAGLPTDADAAALFGALRMAKDRFKG